MVTRYVLALSMERTKQQEYYVVTVVVLSSQYLHDLRYMCYRSLYRLCLEIYGLLLTAILHSISKLPYD